MVRTSLFFGIVVSLLMAVTTQSSDAQNIRQDYKVNVPRTYSPEDPWTIGKVMRMQTGHSGFFYNCDGEEEKRYSPYIHWETQPVVCRPKHPIRWEIDQQICKIKRRIRDGGCGNCNGQSQGCANCGGGGCSSCAANQPADGEAIQTADRSTGRSFFGIEIRFVRNNKPSRSLDNPAIETRVANNQRQIESPVARTNVAPPAVDISEGVNRPPVIQTAKETAQPAKVANKRPRLLDLYR